MINDEARRRLSDWKLVTDLLALNEAAGRQWRFLADVAQEPAVRDMLLAAAKADESIAADLRAMLPRFEV
ncbi:MAG: hypothetical protein IRY95_02670 [Clostridia bacterium]|nr:hypothetical protein [Clostridia bacterium]